MRQFAASWHLHVVPVVPVATGASCHLVLLGEDELTAKEFCELAVTAGARLLYIRADTFDAGTDPDLDLERYSDGTRGAEARESLAELCRDAQYYNGRLHQLELAFVTGCVLHCWAVAAGWYGGLVDRAAALLPYIQKQS